MQWPLAVRQAWAAYRHPIRCAAGVRRRNRGNDPFRSESPTRCPPPAGSGASPSTCRPLPRRSTLSLLLDRRRRISGCAAAKSGRRGTSQRVANDGGAVTFKPPASAEQVLPTASARQSKPARISGSIASPCGVMASARVRRTEKAHTEIVLQPLDLLADGGRGDVQFLGCMLETEVAGRRFEGTQGAERWQAIGHDNN